MRKLSVILLAITLLFTTPAAFAGMLIKKVGSTESVSNGAKISGSERHMLSAEKLISILHLPSDADGKHNDRPRDTSGWEGIVALCCGILGLFTGIMAIPAIIFGALGLARGKKNQGMAIAGLVLGILVLLIVALFIVAIASAF